MNVLVKVGNIKLHRLLRRVGGFQVVEHHPRKIGHDDVARNLVGTALRRERLDVPKSLACRSREILPARLVLANQDALLNDIDPVVAAAKISDGRFEAGDRASIDAEDVEKLIPKRLCLGPFAMSVAPLVGKLNRPTPDLLKRQSHGSIAAPPRRRGGRSQRSLPCHPKRCHLFA